MDGGSIPFPYGICNFLEGYISLFKKVYMLYLFYIPSLLEDALADKFKYGKGMNFVYTMVHRNILQLRYIPQKYGIYRNFAVYTVNKYFFLIYILFIKL